MHPYRTDFLCYFCCLRPRPVGDGEPVLCLPCERKLIRETAEQLAAALAEAPHSRQEVE